MFFLNLLFLLGGVQNMTFEQVDTRSHNRELILQDSDSVTYTATKVQINLLRGSLHNDLNAKRIDIDSVKRTFDDRLTNRIIPYWYGTGWSFGGHTSIPQQGKIACGYFVSTTLKDMGLKLNRYDLAQKSPIEEAQTLSCGSEIKTIVHENPEKALKEINEFTKEGVYFIGFDTGHVGFLIKKKNRLFLIHSTYLSPISVCIEPLANAKVFKKFTKFYLVDISHNDKLMRKWLNDEVLL